MTIALVANDEQWLELSKDVVSHTSWIRINAPGETAEQVDAYIILKEIDTTSLASVHKPVLLHSVMTTLADLHTPGNVVRINGWKGFLARPAWEVSGKVTDEIKMVFAALNKQYIEVKDEPGLIAARIIAMIINEAYFALGEKVSSKEEINIAMKLGTNYPFGPFEWADAAGIKNIYDLLQVLSLADKRYIPSPLLQKEALA